MARKASSLGTAGDGDIFAPKDHQDDMAIAVRCLGKKTLSTKFGDKDAVVVDMATFADRASLKSGEPTEILRNCVMLTGCIVRDLLPLVGADDNEAIFKLGQVPTDKGNPAWIMEDVADAVFDAALDFLEAKDCPFNTPADGGDGADDEDVPF